MSLPVVVDALGYAVLDRSSGELVDLRTASDHAIASAAVELAEHDAHVLQIKRALAAEMRIRHGVGKTERGGYEFTVAESTSWPAARTADALDDLLRAGKIGDSDVLRCMPERPRPDPRQLKSLIGRLMVSDPDAARVLASAATTSPPSLREVRATAIDAA